MMDLCVHKSFDENYKSDVGKSSPRGLESGKHFHLGFHVPWTKAVPAW